MTHRKSTPKIIIASSEAPLRRILSHSFQSLGAEVEEVYSHKRLIGRLQHHHYDIILSRFVEPLLDNQQWRVTMRAKGRATQLWVVADRLSAEESVALIERGVNQLFSLPISTTRLKHKIEHHLAKTAQQWSHTPQ